MSWILQDLGLFIQDTVARSECNIWHDSCHESCMILSVLSRHHCKIWHVISGMILVMNHARSWHVLTRHRCKIWHVISGVIHVVNLARSWPVLPRHCCKIWHDIWHDSCHKLCKILACSFKIPRQVLHQADLGRPFHFQSCIVSP